ncbi:ThuA domain-containing protein [Hellea balneolensis]|uniref:ThuA domain-containing protein n=1 Tax=Hellea balneolensis TaxID=287478 RepID=UPI0004168D0D|nr:ThuA domain-containing protein [Hellea balneolensis]
MKYLSLLSSIILAACSASTSADTAQLQPAKSETVEAIATYEAPPTTGRYFSYVPTPSILIFSETRDWRHEEGIVGADLAIMKAAKDMGLGYFTTEHSAIFNAEELAKFDVVVFNNMTGDALTPVQEAAFETWLAQGKGAVLIHGAGDASHQDWSFYHNEMLGATFVSHPMAPQFQEARVEVLNTSHPVMQGIGKEFMAIDEWYTFEAPPGDDFIVLAGLDESTYSPVNTVYGDRSDLRMGPKPSDHPIIWARCLGDNQSRIVYTAQGHRHETYEAKEATLILQNALNWTARKTDSEGRGCVN